MKSLEVTVLCFIAVLAVFVGCALTQTRSGGGPLTRFTCQGRPTGYYADVDTGCQVYHMCDGMGRQFSYTCPNTTLFQQRMLICDHWYMVNCSRSESDYDANLLIGQRDKPFVSEQEMHMRTPRPDILNVPYNSNYYDGLKQAETKYSAHAGNSIATGPGTSAVGTDNRLDSGKSQFTLPAHTHQHQGVSNDIEDNSRATTQQPVINFNRKDQYGNNNDINRQSTVNLQISSTPKTIDSDEFDLDIRMKDERRPTTATFNFIKRFDPNTPPNSQGTSMTTSQILEINRQLPASSNVSPDDSGARRKSLSSQNNFNTFEIDNGKTENKQSGFRTANTKSSSNFNQETEVPVPHQDLKPPKNEYSVLPSTTMGPPIYYEWKWAVPAFNLEPPKAENATKNSTDSTLETSESGRTALRNFTRSVRPTLRSLEQPISSSSNNKISGPEYDPSSYFVPDYIFPLDNPHPGYQEDGAQTSFQVRVSDKGRSFGENPNCPQCHPAYLKPGTCEPCIVQR